LDGVGGEESVYAVESIRYDALGRHAFGDIPDHLCGKRVRVRTRMRARVEPIQSNASRSVP